jgi:branched-chain amino acid transport system substrate-binding protein
MKLIRVGAAITVASLLVAACGGAATPSPAASQAPGATTTPTTPAAEATPPTDRLRVVTIPAGEPVHFAFWGVLSGADATLGTDSKYGVEIAIDDLGGTFMGHPIQLTSEDGLCTPEGGATAAQKLAADTTIVGLVGSSCSDETVGGIKAITDAGLTTISPSNTRPALTAADRGPEYAGYLRTAHNDIVQGRVAAEFAYNQLGVKTAATIHDGSSYAQALQQVFADNFKQLGGTITIQTAVQKDAVDMKPVLTQVAASKPEFIYYPIFIGAAGYITKQLKEVPGLENVKHMSADGTFSADFVKGAGEAANGHYISSPDVTAFTGDYAGFVTKYKAKFGSAPLSIFHAHAYDATGMLFAALKKVTVQAADGTLYVPLGALRDALFATKDFQGITGTLTCTSTGDCGAKAIGVYQVTAKEVGPPISWPPAAPIWKPTS